MTNQEIKIENLKNNTMQTQMTAIDGTNLNILKNRMELYNKKAGVRVGDWLKLPYGLYTRFTHDWGEDIQTGGSHGFYLGNGYASYSGSLDSSISKTVLLPTNEIKSGSVWFFDKDISGAGRGVDFEADFRVFELKEGADLTPFPKVREYEKEQYRQQAETITRINGNGNPYSMPVPELLILSKREKGKMTDIPVPDGLREICAKYGKVYSNELYSVTVQPLTITAMCKILGAHENTPTFYDNWNYKNTLMIQLT